MIDDLSHSRTESEFAGDIRRWPWKRLALHFLLLSSTIAAVWLVAFSSLPLGVAGEWTWHRSLPPAFGSWQWLPAPGASIAFLVFALFGYRLLALGGTWAAVFLLPLAMLLGGVLQFSLFSLPRVPAGMERWGWSLYSRDASGYFLEATKIRDTREFLANYEAWVEDGDNFHLGTHPPGLIVLNRQLLDLFQARSALAQWVVDRTPRRLADGLDTTPIATSFERATLVSMGMGTWVLSLLTTLPLYWLCRLGSPREDAWLGAVCWLASPACSVLQPVGDCLYPFLAMTALWLTTAAHQARLPILAILAGGVLWIGLMLSLAFLAVAALALVSLTLVSWSQRQWFWTPMLHGVCLAAGIALPTAWCFDGLDLNLLEVWQTNLSKHAGFYDVYPRSYWPWIAVNLVEFTIVCGPAAAILAGAHVMTRAFRSSAPIDRVLLAWLLIVLVLNLSGRNLGETGRLWLFLTPLAMAGAGRAVGVENIAQGRPGSVATTLLACQLAMSIGLAVGVEPLLPVGLEAGAP